MVTKAKTDLRLYKGIPRDYWDVFALLQYTPRDDQLDLHRNLYQYRFVAAACHRRMGKTVAAVMHTWCIALLPPLPYTQVFYIAPTATAAKRIAWPYYSRTVELIDGAVVRLLDHKITLPNSSMIQLLGSDNADALRGIYSDFCVLDEFAFSRSSAWTAVIRPALSDRNGGALFISTVNGKNLFYTLHTHATTAPNWSALLKRASETGVLSQDELDDTRATMGEEDYQREYECRFDFPPKHSVYGRWLLKLLKDRARLVHLPSGDINISLWWGIGNSDQTCVWVVAHDNDTVILLWHCSWVGAEFDDVLECVSGWLDNHLPAATVVESLVPREMCEAEDVVDVERRINKLEAVNFNPQPYNELPLMEGVDITRSWFKRMQFTEYAAGGLDAVMQVRFAFDEKKEALLERFVPSKWNLYEHALRHGLSTPSTTEWDEDEFELDISWVV